MFYKFFALLGLMALAGTPGVAHAKWYEASSEHFVVYSDDSPDDVREFTEKLERFDKAMRLFWARPDYSPGPANRVTIYMVRNPSDMVKLSGSESVAGFYRPSVAGPMAVVPQIRGDDRYSLQAIQVLLHEYAHHFMFANFPGGAYPTWMIEGFAEFHGATRFDRDGSVGLGVVPQYRRWILFDGIGLTLDKLFVADTLKLTGEKQLSLYGTGWLLLHYLQYEPSRAGQFNAYVQAINSGQDALEAAKAIFGDLDQLNRELNRYKRGDVPGSLLPGDAVKPKPVHVRPLTDGEAATINVRIYSKNGVDKDSAPDVYSRAKSAAAPYPNDAGAQLVLTEAAYDARDCAEAVAAADRALAANPKATDAMLYKARCRMRKAHEDKDTSAETLSEIRKMIGAANAMDSQDPEPAILFYRSYVEFGQQPSRNALDAFYAAFGLAPYDPSLRINVAIAYAQDGKPEAAKAVLKPLLYSAHSKKLAEQAAKLIEQLEKGGLDPEATKDGGFKAD